VNGLTWLRRLAAHHKRARADERRWVVLDVEASGLDAAHDRLLAIAAVGVHIDADRAGIVLADSFEVVLCQPADDMPPDKANIVLHGTAWRRSAPASMAPMRSTPSRVLPRARRCSVFMSHSTAR
jgi:hypothetical protein